MKKWIKNFLRQIFLEILKNEEKPYSSSWNPAKINFGKNSKIEKPLEIVRGEKIFVGENSLIKKSSWLGIYTDASFTSENPGIRIGDDVYIGNYCCITAIKRIDIGNGTLISDYFYTSDHVHGFDPSSNLIPKMQALIHRGDVIIGERCFIGYRVSIMPGVHLGNNCVVGAHSVVTHSFPDYSMIAGCPAKLIKMYSFEKKEWVNV